MKCRGIRFQLGSSVWKDDKQEAYPSEKHRLSLFRMDGASILRFATNRQAGFAVTAVGAGAGVGKTFSGSSASAGRLSSSGIGSSITSI